MKDNLDKRFLELEGQFDIEEPTIGHFNRFEAKLSRQIEEDKTIKWNPTTWKWLSVAAAVLLTFGIWFGTSNNEEQGMQLAEVSPEMEEAQSFFVSTINKELESIKLERNDENTLIIDNALRHLEQLELDYNQLTLDLEHTDDDKRIIYAMINNFQQRIEVLQSLLLQLDEIKTMKSELNQA